MYVIGCADISEHMHHAREIIHLNLMVHKSGQT